MHTPYQLKELFVCEQVWPVGERAANERAMMMATLIANSIAGSEGGAKEAFRAYDSLSGTIDPEEMKFYEPTEEQKALEVKLALKAMAYG